MRDAVRFVMKDLPEVHRASARIGLFDHALVYDEIKTRYLEMQPRSLRTHRGPGSAVGDIVILFGCSRCERVCDHVAGYRLSTFDWRFRSNAFSSAASRWRF